MRYAILGVLILPLLAGCAVHRSTIEVLQAEQTFLAHDRQQAGQLYDDRIAELAAKVGEVREAMYADIAARQPLEAAWVVDTMKGVAVAVGMIEAQAERLAEARATVLANIDDRIALLEESKQVVIRSQYWSAEAKEMISSLLEDMKSEP